MQRTAQSIQATSIANHIASFIQSKAWITSIIQRISNNFVNWYVNPASNLFCLTSPALEVTQVQLYSLAGSINSDIDIHDNNTDHPGQLGLGS